MLQQRYKVPGTVASTLEGTEAAVCRKLEGNLPFRNSRIWTGRGEQ